MSRLSFWTVLLVIAVAAVGCGKREEQKPPENIANVTTTQVVARDLPLTESAVGSETWLSQADTYDPTTISRAGLTSVCRSRWISCGV